MIFKRCSSAAVHGVFVLPFLGGGGWTGCWGSPSAPPRPDGSAAYAAEPVTLDGAIVALGARWWCCWTAAAPDERRLRGLVGDVGEVVDGVVVEPPPLPVPPTAGAAAYAVPLKGSVVVWLKAAGSPPDTVSCEGDADMGLGFRLRLEWCGEDLVGAPRLTRCLSVFFETKKIFYMDEAKVRRGFFFNFVSTV